MDSSPQSQPSTGVDEPSAGFASSGERTAQPSVLPVIVQPVVPETTGAIASQAIATVPRPNEGTIRVIDTAGLAELNFNFPTSDVHIAALDVDLVMVFADSSKLILPGLAVGLLGANPPKLNFLGKSVSAQSVISAIDQVTLADASPSIQLASAEFLPKKPSGTTKGDQESATGHDGVGGGEPPIPPPPIVSGGKFDKQSQANETKTGDYTTPPVKEVPAGSLSIAAANSAISSPSVVTPARNIEENAGKSSFAFDSVVTGQLFQTVGVKAAGAQIKGATGAGSADSNPDFAIQNTQEVLSGNATGDEIWGDDPSAYPAGMAGRSLQITLPSASVTATAVTISGVPDTMKILNATYIGGGIYKMTVGAGNTFKMNLAYTLPTEATGKDSDGAYYDGFKSTFSFEFTATNTKGEKGVITASATVGVRDVTSAAEQISLDPTTGKLIVGLSRDPTGNIVNAGGGNDTIHAAAGADQIDGGDGTRDRVVYDLSNDAVSVSLKDGIGAKGFARGDTYTNIEDVVGSNYNDTLIGNANNVLSGGKGNDSIVGGSGANTLIGGDGADTLDGTSGSNDVADYSASTSGVTVDLGAGTGNGGDAAGDVLKNIEVVIGSAQADYLIAAASGSTLIGGAGNDTIDAGGTQTSSLDGGDGANTLDYGKFVSATTEGVSVSLVGGVDARGNQFSNFLNLGGSDYDDTLTGDGGNNTITGGKGNDRFNLSEGNDSFDGGDGSDTVDYSSYAGQGGLNLTLKGTSVAIAQLNSDIKDNLRNIENIIGTRNADRISGDANANNLQGGQGADTLAGNDGNDTLLGSEGADQLSGGAGNDSMDGGSGDNTADYSYLDSNGTYTLRVASSVSIVSTIGNGDVDTLANIENIIGSAGNDCIIGDDAANSLYGGSGNDTFIVGGGGDSIDGSDGDSDTADFSRRLSFATDPNGALVNATAGVSVSLVDGRGSNGDAEGLVIKGVENLIGSYGADTLIGDNKANQLSGGDGDDSLFGGLGNDSLFGGDGSDSLSGGRGDDYIDGGVGLNDTVDYSAIGVSAESVIITGSGASFSLQGNGTNPTFGTDTLINIEKLTLTAYADSVNLLNATSNLTLIGNGGADTLFGGKGHDLIDASASTSSQAVRLSGGLGNDSIIGGASTSDIVDYAYLSDFKDAQQNAIGSVSIVATGTAAFSATGVGGGASDQDIITNIEIFVGAAGNDTLDMRNATGNLSLNGEGGNDLFFSGKGNDTIDGGDGSDTVDYSFLPTGKNVTLVMGGDGKTFVASNSTSGLIGSDTLINIEVIKLTANGDNVNLSTATGNLSLTSGGGGDTISTGSGNDFIDASVSTANVSLTGGGGNDTLIGGSGSDVLTGGANDDSIVGNGGNDTILGGIGFDTFRNATTPTSRISVTSTANKFTITGTAGGTDQLTDVEGLIGTGFADTIDGGNSTMNLFITGNGGADTILTGSGSDTIDASASANNVTLFGGSGNDSILAGSGNDTIDGGTGNDTLVGGAGNDLYIADTPNDVIVEDSIAGSGIDKIYASGTAFNLNINGQNVEQLYHRDTFGNYVASAFTGTGNTLDNYIAGGTGNDCLFGGGGNDTFLWTGGNDTIDGEGVADNTNTGSNDQVDFTNATGIVANETADGNWNILNAAGNLFAKLFNIENIIGTSGKDVFKLSEGTRAITIDGKGDVDTLSYEQLGIGTTVSVRLNGANAGSAVLAGTSNRTDKISNIENITGGAGNDTLIGDTNTNLIMGREGNDQIDGDGGTDTADYSYITTSSTLNGITVTLDNLNTVTVTGNASDQDTLANIENIIGTAKADKIFGDDNANSLIGGDGADTLSGGAGADMLDGGGNVVGTSDMVDFTYVGVGKTLSISGSSSTWAASVLGTTDSDTLYNFEAMTLGKGINIVNLSGINYAVTIDGSNGQSNSIASGTGSDLLLGGTGNDTFSGNGGNDSIDGGASATDRDVVSYAYLDSSTAGVTVTVNNDGTLKGSVAVGDVDNLVNIEAIIGTKYNDSIDLSGITTASRAMSIAAGDGNNSITGGKGNDTLVANNGNNFFDGGDGQNSMAGGSGNDSYFAHSVNDTISDTGGINFLQTDAFQVINLSDPNDPIGKMLTGLAGSGANAPQWILQYRGAGDFSGTGDTNNNSLYGWVGNDSLAGNAGNDYLDGYYGNNTLNGGTGADTMAARGGGNNVFFQDDLGDRFTVILTGNETYGVNTVSTALSYTNLSDSQNGGIRDIVYFGSGAFTAIGSGDGNVIAGGSSNDCLDGFEGNDTLTGAAGDDTLLGGAGDDSLNGGANNDSVVGGLGNDTFDGGAGSDVADYSYQSGATLTASNQSLNGSIHAFSFAVTAQGVSASDLDSLTNIEAIKLGAGANIVDFSALTQSGYTLTIDGSSSGSNSIAGGAGAESIRGTDSGNDTLSGRGGNDTMDAGGGTRDLADYSYLTSAQTLTLNRSSDTQWSSSLTGGGDNDTLSNFEAVKLGQGSNTVNFGSQTTAITIDGSLGAANTITTGSGADSLRGGANADVLSGRAGNDTIDGGDGSDTADYSYRTTATTFTASSQSITNGVHAFTLAVGASGDTDSLTNIEVLKLGTSTNNVDLSAFTNGPYSLTIDGSGSGANSIYGGAGAESMRGGTSNDIFVGGLGNDTIDGGAGTNTLSYNYFGTNGGAITLSALDLNGNYTATIVSGLNSETDQLRNIQSLNGSAGNDTIDFSKATTAFTFNGLGGNNSIAGGSGNDLIVGGAGNNTYSGGLGADTLIADPNGNDVADYSYVAAGVGLSVAINASSTVLSGVTTYITTVNAGGTDVDRLENYIGVFGGINNDTFIGDSIVNRLSGGLGNDSLDGGLGNDTVDYSYVGTGAASAITTGLTLALNGSTRANATVSTGIDVDTVVNIENVVGTQFADTIGGDNNANSIFGGKGNDTINGGIGNTANTDTLDGGDDIDTLGLSLSASNISIVLADGAGKGSLIATGLNAYAADLYNFENIVTSSGADTLVGNSGDNSFDSGTGNDSLAGGGGNDTLSGNAGNDTLDGGGQAGDTASYAYVSIANGVSVTLSSGTFTASVAATDIDRLINIENIIGTKNNDTIIGDVNSNTLDGGAGSDLTSYNDPAYGSSGVSITLASGTTTTFNVTIGSVTDQLINFETLQLTGNDDFVNLAGASSALSIAADNGNDSIISGTAADTINGGAGNDSIVAGDGNNSINGASGSNDTITAGSGNDTIVGGTGANSIAAGDGNNTINGSSGSNNLITSGSGNDTILGGNTGNNSIAAGDGNNTISTGSGNDTIITGSGNDTVSAGAGNNSIIGGGQANDLLSYAFLTAGATGITVALNGNNAVTVSGAQNDTISGFENIIGSSLADSIVGDNIANSIAGGAGIDTLSGGDGNDSLDGGGNNDWVDYSYLSSPSSTLNLNRTSDTAWTASASLTDQDTLANFRAITLGNGTNIVNFGAQTTAVTIDGSKGATDSIAGGTAADSLIGGNNADSIFAGTGTVNDTIRAGTGNDTLDGGLGAGDVADYTYKAGGATYSASLQDASGNTFTLNTGSGDVDTLINMEILRLGGGANIVDLSALTNTAFGFTVDGSAQNSIDSLRGGSGADSLAGGSANDTLAGGLGNDTLDGGQGAGDIADYSYINNGVTLTASGYAAAAVSFTLTSPTGEADRLINIEAIRLGAGNNTLNLTALNNAAYGLTVDGALGGTNSIAMGSGNDFVIGGTGNNTLTGGLGNNTLDGSRSLSNSVESLLGGTGNDSIIGGAGSDTLSDGGGTDTLSGGGGDDVYIVTSTNDRVIETVNSGIDTIQTTATTFTLGSINDATNGANNYIDNLTYTGAAAFSGAGNELDNVITGSFGNDTLSGNAGNDTLVGGGLGTNSITDPNAFDANSWGKTSISVIANQAFGPNDTTVATADQMVNSTVNDWHFISGNAPTANYVTNSAYQTTFYVQNVNNSTKFVQIGFTQGGGTTFNGNQWVNFDLTTGTFGNKGTAISNGDFSVTVLANGWYQISLVGFTSATASALGSSYISILDPNDNTLGGTNSRLPGYAASSLSTVNLWGGALQRVDTSNDSLNGGAGIDSLFGGYGNDTLIGDTGNDTLDGGQGSDTADYSYINTNAAYTQGITVQLNGTQTVNVVALAGSDVDRLVNIENVIGTKFADSLVGDANANSLQGGDGADTLIGGSGNDTLDGGNATLNNAGIDWVDYSYAGNGITVALNGAGGAVTVVAGSDVDTLINIENILGSNNADLITGDSMNNNLAGGRGADTISGGIGNDTIDGNGSGTADSAVDVASYAYLTSVTSGFSVQLNGTATSGSSLALNMASGDVDTLLNIEGIIGGSGADTMIGDALANYLGGGGGNDSFIASLGNDTIDGGAATDTLDYSGLGSLGYYETLSLNSGTVTISKYLSGGSPTFTDTVTTVETITGINIGPSTSSGGSANYATFATNLGLIGTNGADTIVTGSGNDTIRGGLGNDSIDGGAGLDIIDYSYITDPSIGLSVSVQGYTGINTGSVVNAITITNGTDVDTLVNIEGIIGGAGNDTLTDVSPTILIRTNNFAIYGGGGDDLIKIGYGFGKYIDGGTGTNTLDLSYFINTGGSGATLGEGTAAGSFNNIWVGGTFYNIQNMIGATNADSLTGNSGANSIRGNGFNDTIKGMAGNDTLDGGAGSDALDYSYVTTNIAINLNTVLDSKGRVIMNSAVIDSATDSDLFWNFEGVIAGAGNDTLIGNNTGGYFDGGAGTDSIKGGTGADTIRGGLGEDTLDGGAGFDTVNYGYLLAGQALTISRSNATTWIGSVNTGIDTDTLLNFENISMGASAASLTLNLGSATTATSVTLGNTAAANDVINLGSSNDFVTAFGLGTDSADGGLGRDSLNGSAIITNYTTTVVLDSTGTAGTLTLNGAASYTSTFSNFEYFGVVDANSAGKFVGSSNASALYFLGGNSNDTLDDGGGASMSLDGGASNDVYFVRNASTKINEAASSLSIDQVYTTLTTLDISDGKLGISGRDLIENLTYVDATNSTYNPSTSSWSVSAGSSDFSGIGNFVNNNITGGTGNNTLIGGAGADTLLSYGGNDSLVGGGKADFSVATNANFIANGLTTSTQTVMGLDGVSNVTATTLTTSTTASLNAYQASGIGALHGGTGFAQTTIYAKAVTGGARYLQLGVSQASDSTIYSSIVIDLNATSTSVVSAAMTTGSVANGPVVGTFANAGIGSLYFVTFDATTGWYRISLANRLGFPNGGFNITMRVLESFTSGAIPGQLDTTYTGTGKSVLVFNPTAAYADVGDSISGGAGSDTLQGGDGFDTLDGGTGNDIADYSYLTAGVTFDISKFNQTAAQTVTLGSVDMDLVSNIEGIIGGSGNDVFIGDTNANYFNGNGGNDSLFGNDGADTLRGGTGNDTIDGGTVTTGGIDLADYTYTNNALTITLNGSAGAGSSFNVNVGSGDADTVRNVEGLIGGGGADSLTGDSLANYLDGGAGNDTLVGGGGADSLFGGAGNDVLRLDWSSINYRIDGGSGSDTVSYAGSTSNSTLSGSSFSNLLSNAEYLDFSGTSGTVSLTLDGDDIQKILTGSSSTSSNAGMLDLKFDASGDSLTLAANANYSYWQTSDANASTGQIAGGSSFSMTSGTNTYVYVFDTNHTTLLATLHYQV